MYDVRIINNEAVLFEDDVQVENLEPLRTNGKIEYEFDGGSSVCIWYDNNISWYDSDGKSHRDGDMPAFITYYGYMAYRKHGKRHREFGPAVIWKDGSVEYWLDGIEYTKEEFDAKMNSVNHTLSKTAHTITIYVAVINSCDGIITMVDTTKDGLWSKVATWCRNKNSEVYTYDDDELIKYYFGKYNEETILFDEHEIVI